jgi:hypothetical protein
LIGTFLALARKASSLGEREGSLVGWLYRDGSTPISGVTAIAAVPGSSLAIRNPSSPAAGIASDRAQVAVPEGGTATFEVKLADKPTGSVSMVVGWLAGDADIGVTITSAATVPANFELTPYEAWRQANFTTGQLVNLSFSGATADPDQDGMNNQQEYVAHTDPTNQASVFRVTALAYTPYFQVQFLSAADRDSRLLQSGDVALAACPP